VLPEDNTGKAAAALGYLHANCGMPCHSSRGLGEETQLVLRLRADEFWSRPATSGDAGAAAVPAPVAMTDTYLATVNKDPTTAAVAQAFPGARRSSRDRTIRASFGSWPTGEATTKCLPS